jgi:predicted Zn-dependent peptidase
MWRVAAILVAASLLGLSPAPPVKTLRLAGGGTGIVKPLSGAPVAAVELWFRAPSIGFEPQPQPGIANVTALAIAASEPLTGTPLATLVARSGGRFAISVYPQTVEISALVPAEDAPAVLRTMSGVYFTPVLTEAGLTQAVEEARSDQRLRAIISPDEELRDALFAVLFPSGPNHFSPVDASEVANLHLDDVRSFAKRAFRASNATVVLTGAVDSALLAEAVPGRGEREAPEALTVATRAAAPSTPQVTRSASVPGFGYAWTGPAIKDERAATALDFVADYLFNPDTGLVTKQIGEVAATIDAQYVTYYDPGIFYVEATGNQAAAVRGKIDDALTAMRKPLDPKVFESARRRFEYHVTSDVSTPLSLADNFGWYASEGNAAYAPGADVNGGRYISSVRALTPQLVAQTVQKFLSAAPATVTLEQKASK